ncbi:MAG: acetylxylan esterase [Bryobacterales bacterium]|nr:acetylxylan esterase [Bryobacterales bacterium]
MLTRRQLAGLLTAGSALPLAGMAQSPPERGLYRDYSRCLPEFLARLAKESYHRRKAAIAALQSPEAIAERQRWVTDTFWKLAGGMPARTPLNPRTTGAFERRGYRVEKLVYESQPGLLISANLYVPANGTPPYPGVLFQMGHATNGKASAQYQRCCQGLARLGYLVLAFDPMGQGERTYYPGPQPSLTRLNADEEHTRPGRQMLLKGDSSARLQTWDCVRSLDYLAAHPLVDPTRLASTGQSGGGTNTMLLAAVDSRLSVAAISCPNTENVAIADFNSPGSTDDAEQNLIASAPLGFDRWDLLYPLAPKPLLVAVSERDFFGTYSPRYISNGLEEFATLERVYRTLGHPERIQWFSTPLPHGLSHDMRVQIYRWLERWLQAKPRAIDEEPETAPEPDEQLFVSPHGSMVVDFGGATPFSLNRQRVIQRTPADLAELIGADPPPPAPPLRPLATARYRTVHIEAVEFPSAAEVGVPAWVFRPPVEDPDKPILLLLHPSGRAQWREGDLYEQLAVQGHVVCAPDLRNQGDLRPEFGRGVRGHADSHNSEEHYAWASLILGKPLLGQRVTDILAAIQGLRSRPQWARRPIAIAALGFTTVPALFAAAIGKGVGSLYLANGLLSFEALCQEEDYNHPFGNFIPRLLLHTDLPSVAISLAPNRITLGGAVDGAGGALPLERIRQTYPGDGPRTAHIRFQLQGDWDAAAISRAIMREG